MELKGPPVEDSPALFQHHRAPNLKSTSSARTRRVFLALVHLHSKNEH